MPSHAERCIKSWTDVGLPRIHGKVDCFDLVLDLRRFVGPRCHRPYVFLLNGLAWHLSEACHGLTGTASNTIRSREISRGGPAATMSRCCGLHWFFTRILRSKARRRCPRFVCRPIDNGGYVHALFSSKPEPGTWIYGVLCGRARFTHTTLQALQRHSSAACRHWTSEDRWPGT